jgi:hypothetical protein
MGKKGKAGSTENRPQSSNPTANSKQHLATLLPHLRERPLGIQDLLPANPLSFITIQNFLSPKECDSIVSLGPPGSCIPAACILLPQLPLFGGRAGSDRVCGVSDECKLHR